MRRRSWLELGEQWLSGLFDELEGLTYEPTAAPLLPVLIERARKAVARRDLGESARGSLQNSFDHVHHVDAPRVGEVSVGAEDGGIRLGPPTRR